MFPAQFFSLAFPAVPDPALPDFLVLGINIIINKETRIHYKM